MKFFTFLFFVIALLNHPAARAQESSPPRIYAHKMVVQEILQTKSYTYLHVTEKINNRDSLIWLALPFFEPAVGETYYYESGLQMGEFHSKELDRTFDDVLFLGNLSTGPEAIESNIAPAFRVLVKDTTKNNLPPPEIHTVVVKQVLQTSGYTYLRVTEGNKEQWIAVVKIPATVGQTYTYSDGSRMTNFQSKELNKTFKEILLVAQIKLETGSKNK